MELTEHTLQWMRDLLSGEFVQGGGHLVGYFMNGSRSGRTYCCLGVLAFRMWPGWRGLDPRGETYLNADQLREVGMSPGEQRQLAALNDSRLPFRRIADVIAQSIVNGIPVDELGHDDVPVGAAVRLIEAHDVEHGAS